LILKSGKSDDAVKINRISLYILASQLNISPAEAYEMPYSMVRDLLLIHGIVKETEAKEMERAKGKQNGRFS